MVVVTLSQRFNLFGFLYLADLGSGFDDSGNADMLNLVLALPDVCLSSVSPPSVPSDGNAYRARHLLQSDLYERLTDYGFPVRDGNGAQLDRSRSAQSAGQSHR
jgi:hypothetical protein